MIVLVPHILAPIRESSVRNNRTPKTDFKLYHDFIQLTFGFAST